MKIYVSREEENLQFDADFEGIEAGDKSDSFCSVLLLRNAERG